MQEQQTLEPCPVAHRISTEGQGSPRFERCRSALSGLPPEEALPGETLAIISYRKEENTTDVLMYVPDGTGHHRAAGNVSYLLVRHIIDDPDARTLYMGSMAKMMGYVGDNVLVDGVLDETQADNVRRKVRAYAERLVAEAQGRESRGGWLRRLASRLGWRQ